MRLTLDGTLLLMVAYPRECTIGTCFLHEEAIVISSEERADI